MTETLAAFLAILSLWCLARFDAARTPFNAAMAGGAIGLAALCRPTFLPWLGLVAVTMLAVRGRIADCGLRIAESRQQRRSLLNDFGWRLANFTGLVIAAGAVMSPWAIRNYQIFGKPIVTTTHGGYTFYLGNNPGFYAWLNLPKAAEPWRADSLPAVDSATLVGLDSKVELDDDKWWYQWAWYVIEDQPRTFARACVYRVIQLWSPLPHRLTADESTGRGLLRYATCAWYCGVYVLAAVGIWRVSRRAAGTAGATDGTPQRALIPATASRGPTALRPYLWGVLLCLAFTAVHTFYWTNLRMRAPLMPFVAIVAAAVIKSKR